jgi:hypothetical protein
MLLMVTTTLKNDVGALTETPHCEVIQRAQGTNAK